MALWRLLYAKNAELLDAFAANLRSGPPGVPPEIPAAIAELLTQLILLLRQAEGERRATLAPGGRLLAGQHGEIWHERGRGIYTLVVQFLILHETILQFAEEHEVEPSGKEHRALVRGIHRAVAEAVQHFAEARDAQLQRAHAEHFAFLAHEIRAPLANIAMGVHLFEEGTEAATVAPRVRRAVDRMRELLDNEIARARFDARAPLRREPISLGSLLDELIDDAEPQAADRKITLHRTLEPELSLRADPRLLRSVLMNLIGNAIKFSSPGSAVHVRARQAPHGLTIEVSDRCGGVPPDKLSGLFVPFEQVGRDRSGFGLGLAIAKEAVELHGGRMRVDNDPGRGCTMVVELPLDEPPDEPLDGPS